MLTEMLTAAVAFGHTIIVLDEIEDVIDYRGNNVRDAMDAIEAVDEISVEIFDGEEFVGWAYIINDLDEDERITDCWGWVEVWLELR